MVDALHNRKFACHSSHCSSDFENNNSESLLLDAPHYPIDKKPYHHDRRPRLTCRLVRFHASD